MAEERPPLLRTSVYSAAPPWAPRARRTGWIAAGGVAILGGAAVGWLDVSGTALVGLVGLAASARIAAARAAMKLTLARLPVREHDELDALADRSRVRLRGKVVAGATVSAVLMPRAAAASAVAFDIRYSRPWRLERTVTYLFEAAQDFSLVDRSGVGVPIRVSGATLAGIVRSRGWTSLDDAARIGNLPLPPSPAGWERRGIGNSSEALVEDGQEVQIIGTKMREVAVSGTGTFREAPTRTVIATGELPLVIFA